jgi:glycosyltransferase involved in cell wall biosynthesis
MKPLDAHAHRSQPRRRPRVLLVVDSLDVGGAERHVCALGEALAARGYIVGIACSTGGVLAGTLPASVAVHVLCDQLVKRRLSLPFAWALACLLRREAFDLVHAHMYASGLASAFALLGSAVPLVITEHSEAVWRGRRARWAGRQLYQRAAQVIAVSPGIRQRLIEQDGAPPERTTVILNALAVPRAPSGAPAAVVAWPATGPRVGVVARLQPEKGVEYFLGAAALVALHRRDVHFIVVGDGPLRHALQARTRALGISAQMHFLGFRLDAPSLIGALDLLVVPSLSEGTPLVVLEAMTAGVPVVAAAVGGIPTQVRHGREGLLVPSGDPEALAQAILRVLQAPAWARQLGDAGRRRVAAQFSQERMLQQIEGVYHATLTGALMVPQPNGRS